MRRFALIVFLIIGLLYPWPTAIHARTEVTATGISVHSVNWSSPAVLPPPVPSSKSPSSFEAVAYVTNISDLVHWQQLVAGRVNVTRQLGLLYSLSSLDSRHPFVEGGNISLQILVNELTALGLSVTEDWFPILCQVWNGTHYIHQPFWTCNLYVCPWGVNASHPTLVVTSHVDSARNSILGFTPTDAPGANDNAAGVASVFEALAALTTIQGIYSGWNVVFAFLGGEEGNGTLSLWGSRQLINNGFTQLGVDPSNVLVMNVDEIGYSGLFWPTQLALYRYSGESINSLLDTVEDACTLLGIPLQDSGNPRVTSEEEVQSYLAWGVSEWTFHTNGIPSLTLSTDQYPDPYKHSNNDIASRCSSVNLKNASRLLAATIISLAYNIPSQPDNYIEEWIPHLGLSAVVTVIDYLDVTEDNYSAYIVDPALHIDYNLANDLLQRNCSMLALGRAGASLMHLTTGGFIAENGTQTLNVTGYRAFHPAINSLQILTGDDAKPFKTCQTVYAIETNEHLLVLVGNHSWCAMGYYHNPAVNSPILYIGVDTPISTRISEIGTASLAWLLEETSEGLCLGLDAAAPQVGGYSTLYLLMYDFISWTGIPNQPLQVDVTVSLIGANYSTHLVTNESGLASLSLWLQSPTPLNITVEAGVDYTASLSFSPLPVCTAITTIVDEVLQGEVISVVCEVNSSWTTAAYVICPSLLIMWE
ncbi:MAG: M28 family metallopeptidase, partial [Promethearchaeota archaeon]